MIAAKALTGKAAVGLVTYHLGRIGLDFTLTLGNSGFGDVWAQLPDRKVGLEVKGSTGAGHKFLIATRQLARVDFYVLVHVPSGVCYVAAVPEIVAALRQRHKRSGSAELGFVMAADLPAECRHGWGRLSGEGRHNGAILLRDRPPSQVKPRSFLRQRADGSVWRVTYDRRNGGRLGEPVLVSPPSQRPSQLSQAKVDV